MTPKPKFPIKINGNTNDGSVAAAADASETSYILIQTHRCLCPSQMQQLVNLSIVIYEYVPKNAYLCGYRDVDLDRIRHMDFVVFVDIYRMESKISRGLKEVSPSVSRQVDVIFHKDVNPKDFQTDIAEKAHLNAEDLEFCPQKVRLNLRCKYLNDLASIDRVRSIEEVGDVDLRNDCAMGSQRWRLSS